MTAQPAAPANPMLEMVRTTVTDQITQANSLVTRINSATTDKGKLVHDLRSTSDDPRVVSFREWFEMATAEIERRTAAVDEIIKAELMPASEDFNVEEAKEQYKALRDSVKAALTFVQTVGGYDAESFKVPDLQNLRGGSSGGTGQGGKRPRLNRIWVGDDLISKTVKDPKSQEEREVSNFTLAAQHISKAVGAKVEVKDLQQAAFGAAGTDDLSTLGGKVFEYYFEAGEGDKRQNFKISVEPKNPTDGDSSAETESVETETVETESSESSETPAAE